MKYLALDLGLRRSGVAFFDDLIGVPVALETIEHETQSELLREVLTILAARGIDRVIVGLPLLPGGSEGEQAGIVRAFSRKLTERGYRVTCKDERYSTPRNSDSDPDSAAALSLLP